MVRLAWLRTVIPVVLALAWIGLLCPSTRIEAQDGSNLLVNPGFEGEYTAYQLFDGTIVNEFYIADGWNPWYDESGTSRRPEYKASFYTYNDTQAQQFFTVYSTLTAGLWQRVETAAAGQTYRFSLAVYNWSSSEDDGSISTDPGIPTVRVGIDPHGEIDPASPDIVWSPYYTYYDEWRVISVDAVAASNALTVYFWVTHQYPVKHNDVVVDEAYLGPVAQAPAVAPAEEPPEPAVGVGEAPYVVPQGVRPDGSVIHTVQSGDTLSSIAFAYHQDYGVTVETIAAINDRIRPNTRFLQIGQEIMILPPGSVDPATGRLLPTHEATPAGTAPTPAAAPGDATPTATGVPPTTSRTPTRKTPPDAGGTSTGEAVPAATQPLGEAVPVDIQPLGGQAPSGVPPTDADTPTPAPTETPPGVARTETAQAVADADRVPPAELVADTGTLCVTVYHDKNRNARREQGELPLAGSQIVLAPQTGGSDLVEYDGAEDPLCIDLAPGQYRVSATLPPDHGLTTDAGPTVTLWKGHRVDVLFGGAEGVALPEAAEAEPSDLTPDAVIDTGAAAPMVDVAVESEEPASDEETSILEPVYDYSGLILLGLAGVLLVSGATWVLVRRRAPR